jgi:hypothetical protein
MLARLAGMMQSVVLVPVGHVSMMPRRLVITALVLLRCGAMMLRRMFVVFCRFTMMLGSFFRHGISFGIETSPMLTADCDARITPP